MKDKLDYIPEETKQKILQFFLKTSVPRFLAEERQNKKSYNK